MYDEIEPIPISALQHFVFCERQCALIYIENVWAENRLTSEGRVLHERSDGEEVELRAGIRIVRGLRIASYCFGLIGRADVVEFHPDNHGTRLSGVEGVWKPIPIEYKRGRPKPDHCDEVQLCAQALCLEEMLHCNIHQGWIYYGQPRRRTSVEFTEDLRSETLATVVRVRELLSSGITPVAHYEKKCKSCSLMEMCLPKVAGNRRKVSSYLADVLRDDQ